MLLNSDLAAMKKFILFLMMIGLVSCGKPSDIKKQIAGCDSLVINFNQPGTDLLDKTMTTTESKAINELIGFVDARSREVGPCPLDGNLMFFNKGELKADVSFTYSIDSCRQFIMKLGDKFMSTQMSNKAIDLLKSLKEGRGFY